MIRSTDRVQYESGLRNLTDRVEGQEALKKISRVGSRVKRLKKISRVGSGQITDSGCFKKSHGSGQGTPITRRDPAREVWPVFLTALVKRRRCWPGGITVFVPGLLGVAFLINSIISYPGRDSYLYIYPPRVPCWLSQTPAAVSNQPTMGLGFPHRAGR